MSDPTINRNNVPQNYVTEDINGDGIDDIAYDPADTTSGTSYLIEDDLSAVDGGDSCEDVPSDSFDMAEDFGVISMETENYRPMVLADDNIPYDPATDSASGGHADDLVPFTPSQALGGVRSEGPSGSAAGIPASAPKAKPPLRQTVNLGNISDGENGGKVYKMEGGDTVYAIAQTIAKSEGRSTQEVFAEICTANGYSTDPNDSSFKKMDIGTQVKLTAAQADRLAGGQAPAAAPSAEVNIDDIEIATDPSEIEGPANAAGSDTALVNDGIPDSSVFEYEEEPFEFEPDPVAAPNDNSVVQDDFDPADIQITTTLEEAVAANAPEDGTPAPETEPPTEAVAAAEPDTEPTISRRDSRQTAKADKTKSKEDSNSPESYVLRDGFITVMTPPDEASGRVEIMTVMDLGQSVHAYTREEVLELTGGVINEDFEAKAAEFQLYLDANPELYAGRFRELDGDDSFDSLPEAPGQMFRDIPTVPTPEPDAVADNPDIIIPDVEDA